MTPLERLWEFKFLGVGFEERVKWKVHKRRLY